MKASWTNRSLSALGIAVPLLVLGAGWAIARELSASVIVLTAVAATLTQIALTLRADLQTVLDVEYEVYQRAATVRQSRLLAWQDRQDRVEAAARIHDSVINTLCAASMTPAGARRQQLQERCQRDLVELHRFAEQAPVNTESAGPDESWFAELSQCARDHASKVGVELEIESDTPRLAAQVDTVTLAGLELAVRESLTNIAKHASVKSARVLITEDVAGLRIVVTNPEPSRSSGSSTWSAGQNVALDSFSLFSLGAAVQASVASELAGGLRVEIRPATPGVQRPQSIQLAVRDHIEVPLFRTVNFWLTGLSIIVMAMFFGALPWGWWLFAGLLTVSASMALTNLYSLAKQIRPALAVALVISTGLLVASPALIDQPALGHWLVLLPATILLVMASWVGPQLSYAWATLAASLVGAALLLHTQLDSGSIPGELIWAPWAIVGTATVLGVGIVLGSQWVRSVIDRSTQRTEAELERAATEADLAAVASRQAEIRHRLIGRCTEAAEPILGAIAAGTADLGEPNLCEEVRRLERLLRSAISLGREQDQLSELLFDLLWHAYDQDVELRIASYRPELLDPTAVADQLSSELVELLGALPPGSVVSASTYETSQGGKLLLVSEAPGAETEQVHEFWGN